MKNEEIEDLISVEYAIEYFKMVNHLIQKFECTLNSLDMKKHLYRDIDLLQFCSRTSRTTIDKINYLMENNQVSEEWIQLGDEDNWFFNCCFLCHEPIVLETNGEELRIKNSCPYPKGITNFSTILKVPSGQIIISDNIQELHPMTNYAITHQNKAEYKKQSLEAEKQNVAFGYCGNTDPFIYQYNDNLIIGTDNLNLNNYEKIAQINTKMFSYCLADYQDYINHNGTLKENQFVVNVKPGEYQVTHSGFKDCYKRPPQILVRLKYKGKCR
jgi:hypothetical protein